MALGTPLSTLREMLKAQCGDSLVVGTQKDTTYNQLLSSRQKLFASEFDWAFLEDEWDVAVPAGSRYLTWPTVDVHGNTIALDRTRPFWAEVLYNQRYNELQYGVDSTEYNHLNSDLGQVSDPIQRWRFVDDLNIVVPTNAQVTTGITGVLTGTFQWAISFVTTYGETPKGLEVGFAFTTQKANLYDIPIATGAAAPFVTARKLYRTKAGGSVFYYLTTLSDNVTTTYTDNAADVTLTVAYAVPSPVRIPRIEVWPMNSTAQTIRLTGQRELNDLVVDTDTADLDDELLTLSVAIDILSRSRKADAEIKLQMASRRLQQIRSGLPEREHDKCIFGGSPLSRDRELRRLVPVVLTA